MKKAISHLSSNEDYLKKVLNKNQIISFKQSVTYEHFKELLARNGQEDRLDEVRLGISHEFLNQVNLVLYQLWIEIGIKMAKHAQIFQGIHIEDGFSKLINAN